MRLLPALAALWLAAPGIAQGELGTTDTPVNLRLLATIPLPPCSTAGVWSLGDTMLLARRHLGFSVVDASDPSQPVEVTVHPPGYPVPFGGPGCSDVKADGRWIYATSEAVLGGVYIYDTQPSPLSPTLVTLLTDQRLLIGVHNVWIDGDILYCASDGSRRIEVYDVRDRTAPVWLSALGNEVDPVWAHDVVVLDGRAYCSFATDGIAIYDVGDPARPKLLGHTTYPTCFTHNMWPSLDGRYLYTTDENVTSSGVGGFVRVFDIARLPAITQVGSYKAGPTPSVVHCVVVHGDLLFVSYYKEGVRVCSLADPANPVEIASFDTWAGQGGGCHGGFAYAGCWGVHPFDLSRIFVSDLDAGGFILQLDVLPHALTTGGGIEPPAGSLACELDWRNAAPVALAGFGVVQLGAVNGQLVQAPLLVDVRTLAAGQRVRTSLAFDTSALPSGTVLDLWGSTGTLKPLLVGPRSTLQLIVR